MSAWLYPSVRLSVCLRDSVWCWCCCCSCCRMTFIHRSVLHSSVKLPPFTAVRRSGATAGSRWLQRSLARYRLGLAPRRTTTDRQIHQHRHHWRISLLLPATPAAPRIGTVSLHSSYSTQQYQQHQHNVYTRSIYMWINRQRRNFTFKTKTRSFVSIKRSARNASPSSTKISWRLPTKTKTKSMNQDQGQEQCCIRRY